MLLFVVGLSFAVAGGYGVHLNRRLNRIGERVTGVVVGLRQKAAGTEDGTAWHPVLAFRTLDGRDIQAVAGVGNGSSRFVAQPGEQVPVIYDPRNPARAEINTRAGRAGWLPILFIIMGVALICYGLFREIPGKA